MPQAKYEFRIFNSSGVEQFRLNDISGGFAYTKEVNAPGLLTFAVHDSHRIVSEMDRDWQVEIHRRRDSDDGADNAISKYIDFRGLLRDETRQADENGQTRVTYTIPGDLNLLGRAIVAYPAETNNRSKFTSTAAETIAKTLVQYNATSDGTVLDGRARAVDISTVSIEADGAEGNALDFFCAWQDLLSALQDVARIGGIDFDLVHTGAGAWEFRTYTGQLGTDRSEEVTFALQYGNMRNPVLRRNWLSERTVAIVGGQGQEASRNVRTRTGTNYNSTTNSTEVFVSAADVSTDTGLDNRGDRHLDELEAKNEIQFDVIQTPGSLYGRDYFLGDLVSSYYQGITNTKQIQSVTVSVSADGKEDVKIGLKNA